jgi:bacteriocin biosynthesis cyclodehydratase domain-containing protein
MVRAVPERPYLKPWYRITRDDGRLLLEYGQVVTTLSGRAVQRLLPALLPLLDGTRTLDEVVAVLGEPIEPAVVKTLSTLAERGVLTDGPPLPEDTPIAYEQTAQFLAASVHALSMTEAQAALERARVATLGSSTVAEEITRLLRLAAVGDVERIAGPEDARSRAEHDLVIVAPANEDLRVLEAWNRTALTAAQPWFQILPYDGKFAAIGPLYLPDITCCYECYRLRRRANVGYSTEFPVLERSRANSPSPPSLSVVVAGLAATIVLRWLTSRDRSLPGAFYALEYEQVFGLSFHRVYRVPRCSECSGLADVAPPLPWYKAVTLDDR